MMSSLSGRRILFIAPRFFGYEQDIAGELVRRGALVDTLLDRPFESSLAKALTRLRPELIIGAVDRLYHRELNRLGRAEYEMVLVVNGQTLSESMLKRLRLSYPRARFILYMWDSFHNRKSAIRNLRYFDDCLSFDRECARNFGLRFRPLFFSPGFENQGRATFDHHLSFIGTAHTDRYAITARIAGALPSHLRFYRYLYLQAPWVYYAYSMTNSSFRGARLEDFHFRPLSRSDVQQVFFSSRAVLDIEHPRQTGLTIRTLETLGAARKLVTTNLRIQEYDFYQPENVCLIERHTAKVPVSFLETPYRPLDPILYRKYSLSGWMDEVLAGTVGDGKELCQ